MRWGVGMMGMVVVVMVIMSNLEFSNSIRIHELTRIMY